VPESAVIPELWSLSTSENAVYASAILRSIGAARAVVVSSSWHLPRALASFRACGVEAEPLAASPESRRDRRGIGAIRARLDALLVAEQRGVATDVTAADQASRSVRVRRAAARALTRIGGESAEGGLVRALSDEDHEVVAWAAYGLGFSCAGHEHPHVSAL